MSKKKKKLDLAALASIPLIMTLANSMLIPVLPLMQKKLKISAMQTSLIITIYAAVSIFCIPIAGYLSDRFGRKRVIIIGLSIAAVGGLVSGLAAWLLQSNAAYYTILTGRFIQGVGAAGAFPIVIPLVGDMFDSKEDVSSGLGMIETFNTLGKVLSPIFGSALAIIIWFLPLAIIPVISALSVVAVIFLVKMPKQKAKSDDTLGSFFKRVLSILKEKKWLFAIFSIGGIAMFVMFGFLYYLSSVLESLYNIEGIWKGLLLAIPLSAICLASFLAGKVIGESKFLMKWITVIGATILTVAMLALAIFGTKALAFLITIMFIGGLGLGFALPCLDSLITQGIEKEQRGSITSIYSSMRFAGVATGPLVASMILNNKALLFYICAGLALLCVVIAFFGIKPKKLKQQSA